MLLDGGGMLARVFAVAMNDEISVKCVDLKELRSPALPDSPLRVPDLDEVFVLYLIDISKRVSIRIHYSPHGEERAHIFFSEHGITLPDDIRPVRVGLRGGRTEQRSVSGCIEFPTPDDQSILPEGAHTFGGRTRIETLGTVIAVLKIGFPITCYTKFTG
jgi:hypothetical protein